MLLVHNIMCTWGSGETGLGVRALGRVAEMTSACRNLVFRYMGAVVLALSKCSSG